MVDNVQPRSLSCFRIRKRRHKNRMDLRRAKTQEPLNMTWAGKQSEQPRSFQSPEKYLLLTFPFIERACGKLRGYRYSASDRTKKAGILDSGLVDHEMVAGACNHPNCLVLPFRLELIRPAAKPHAGFW